MLSGNKSIKVSSYELSQSDEIQQLPKVYSVCIFQNVILFCFLQFISHAVCDTVLYIITCRLSVTLLRELPSVSHVYLANLPRFRAIKIVLQYYSISRDVPAQCVGCGTETCEQALKLFKYCPINQKEGGANT